MGEGGSAFLVVQLPPEEEQKEENVLADRKKRGKHTHRGKLTSRQSFP